MHGLIEETGARFWMTGSSARKLRRGQANLLAGRAITRRLHPLTAAEMGPAFDLERALRLGTLPPLLHLDDTQATDLLRSYADTYLREEIQAEALVRNLGGFARFLDVVAAQDGELLNVSAIARDAAVASRTVQEYVQVLVDTLVAFRLEPWTRGIRSRPVRHPKLYLFDTGVGNALRARLGAALTPANRGRLFERWLVSEILRLLDYGFPEARAYFWRTNHGAEVDLLIEQHGRLRVAIELKCRDHISGADLSGLRSFAKGWPDVPLVVACTAPRRSTLHGVAVLPYAELLSGLGEWLA